MMLMQIWKRYETFLRYAIVGTIGTAVDVGILTALTLATHIDPKTSPLLPLFVAIAFVAAVINNYILNRIWTFKSQDKNVSGQFMRFLAVSLVGFVMTEALMWLLVPKLGLNVTLAKAMTSMAVMIWNFGLNKLWTFRQPPVSSTALSS